MGKYKKIKDIKIVPNLSKHLQPEALNTKFCRAWHAQLGKRSEAIGPARSVPKKSNFLKGRPIGDQSAFPLALLYRAVSRTIDWALSKLPAEIHFDAPSPTVVNKKLFEIRDKVRHKGGMSNNYLLIDSEDIVACFTHIVSFRIYHSVRFTDYLGQNVIEYPVV